MSAGPGERTQNQAGRARVVWPDGRRPRSTASGGGWSGAAGDRGSAGRGRLRGRRRKTGDASVRRHVLPGAGPFEPHSRKCGGILGHPLASDGAGFPAVRRSCGPQRGVLRSQRRPLCPRPRHHHHGRSLLRGDRGGRGGPARLVRGLGGLLFTVPVHGGGIIRHADGVGGGPGDPGRGRRRVLLQGGVDLHRNAPISPAPPSTWGRRSTPSTSRT